MHRLLTVRAGLEAGVQVAVLPSVVPRRLQDAPPNYHQHAGLRFAPISHDDLGMWDED